jgi:Lectin C-type domain
MMTTNPAANGGDASGVRGAIRKAVPRPPPALATVARAAMMMTIAMMVTMMVRPAGTVPWDAESAPVAAGSGNGGGNSPPVAAEASSLRGGRAEEEGGGSGAGVGDAGAAALARVEEGLVSSDLDPEHAGLKSEPNVLDEAEAQGFAWESVDVGVAGEEDSALDRNLKSCAPLACVPDIHFASVKQALADPETQLYDEDDSVCKASFPTVLLLAGLRNCQAAIGSVKLTWTRPDKTKYNWVEKEWPYTVFSDSYPASFNSKVLGVGTHKLNVEVRRPDGCIALARTYTFQVRADACPVGMDNVKTRAPTKRPTKPPSKAPTKHPTKAPTKPPTTPPTKLPTLSPTTEDDAPFCRSLEYFHGHLYGANASLRNWHDHQKHLESMPRCCGGKLPHLATITSVEEAYMLMWIRPDIANLWIGLALHEDANGTRSHPVWTTGEEVSLFPYNFYIGDFGDCFALKASIGAGPEGSFASWNCSDNLAAVFEYECDQLVPDPKVTYPEKVPDGDYCRNLTYYNGHLYSRTKETFNFYLNLPNNALPYSRRRFGSPCCGGKWPHLVSIADEDENKFVRKLAFQDRGPLLGETTSVLLGLADVKTEGQHEWRNGEPVTYTNWHSPLSAYDEKAASQYLSDKFAPLFNDIHDCVVMMNDGSWKSSLCLTEYYSTVFEWDCEIPIPEVGRNTLPPSPNSQPTKAPTARPTKAPTKKPSLQPTPRPTLTQYPTMEPMSAFCKSLTYHNGHLYGVDSTPRGWEESQAFLRSLPKCCNGKVAHLVTITDDVENGFVLRLADPGSTWIGLSRTPGSRFDFHWVTNETFAFANQWWIYGLGAGDCTFMLSYEPIFGGVGLWENRECPALLPMVFEYDCEEADGGRIPLPRHTLQPTVAPTFCQSLTPYKGHLYGAYYSKDWLDYEYIADPPPGGLRGIGIEDECCGAKIHLATLAKDGEFSVALSVIQQLPISARIENFLTAANDRRVEGLFEWLDSDEPVEYPHFNVGLGKVAKFDDYLTFTPPYLEIRTPNSILFHDWAEPFNQDTLHTNNDDSDCIVLSGSAASVGFCDSTRGFLFEYDCGTTVCESDYHQFEGHLYGVRPGQRFMEAVINTEGGRSYDCCDKAPKLVTIESAAENLFVASLLRGVGEAWIGLSDLALEGSFEWGVSGVRLSNESYTNWAGGEPNDGGPRWQATEDCVAIRGDDGKWYDTDCLSVKWYVIEFDCDR